MTITYASDFLTELLNWSFHATYDILASQNYEKLADARRRRIACRAAMEAVKGAWTSDAPPLFDSYRTKRSEKLEHVVEDLGRWIADDKRGLLTEGEVNVRAMLKRRIAAFEKAVEILRAYLDAR